MNEPIPESTPRPLELWGGIECSCVRVGDAVRDQLDRTGHRDRFHDLELIAELGVKVLRYPVLWEHHAREGGIDWGWADERLAHLRHLGIRPIIGFVHHGSGALPDGLLAPDFATGLARFARAVAERYPWIDAYTPVNEPATTARFSGLYGLWHPHGRDIRAFGQCFLNQCLGTRAAMKAIREVNPRAELVQTEDVGKVHSTARLAYQAAYENERRWLTFDVLCGRIDPRHPVHAHLVDCGVSLEQLESFVDDPCPPDILGMNHYVTSERFLDERLERYPDRTHGGNGRERYADVDAVRVRAEGLVGIRGLLRELWDRYRRPIALTEIQLACTREEQMRWLVDAWHQALAARLDGVHVRALTAWALLGSFDWDSLLVENRGTYETGAFDVRGPKPRLTAVGRTLRELARTGRATHPAAAGPGWWRRPIRLEYPAVSARSTGGGTALAQEPVRGGQPLLLAGASTRLGKVVAEACEVRGLRVVPASADAAGLDAALRELRPWAVVDCATYLWPREDGVESAALHRHSVAAAERFAAAAVPLLAFSSDRVFDGTTGRPYVESDAPCPSDVVGSEQAALEQRIAAVHRGALIVRAGPLFGPDVVDGFPAKAWRELSAGRPVVASREHIVSPTLVPELVNAALDLLIDGERGRWHVANQGAVTWFDWALLLAELLSVDRDLVRPQRATAVGGAAPVRCTALASERGWLLPPWQRAMERFIALAPRRLACAA